MFKSRLVWLRANPANNKETVVGFVWVEHWARSILPTVVGFVALRFGAEGRGSNDSVMWTPAPMEELNTPYTERNGATFTQVEARNLNWYRTIWYTPYTCV